MNRFVRFAGILLYVVLIIYALGFGEQLYKHFKMANSLYILSLVTYSCTLYDNY